MQWANESQDDTENVTETPPDLREQVSWIWDWKPKAQTKESAAEDEPRTWPNKGQWKSLQQRQTITQTFRNNFVKVLMKQQYSRSIYWQWMIDWKKMVKASCAMFPNLCPLTAHQLDKHSRSTPVLWKIYNS